MMVLRTAAGQRTATGQFLQQRQKSATYEDCDHGNKSISWWRELIHFVVARKRHVQDAVSEEQQQCA